jgi:PhzF family phenazine biosynthesis protein
MRAVAFRQVDVFTPVPFLGNPVAVVLDARELSDEDMARIARWTNLSETTFVLPSTRASYRLRIFTPRGELPFAGHPTIGSAHAMRDDGRLPADAVSVVQECGAGLVPISFGTDGVISARVPRPTVRSFDEAAAIAPLLGAPAAAPRIVDVGARWVVAALASPTILAKLAPDMRALADLSRRTDTTGVTLYALDEAGVEVRSFAPAHGVDEDPVCGSGNAAVGAHLRVTGGIARFPDGRYWARQGKAVGRDGTIAVALDGEDVSIGGHAVTVIAGTIQLP